MRAQAIGTFETTYQRCVDGDGESGRIARVERVAHFVFAAILSDGMERKEDNECIVGCIGWEQNRLSTYVPDESAIWLKPHLIVSGDDAPSIRGIRGDLGHGQDAAALGIDVVGLYVHCHWSIHQSCGKVIHRQWCQVLDSLECKMYVCALIRAISFSENSSYRCNLTSDELLALMHFVSRKR